LAPNGIITVITTGPGIAPMDTIVVFGLMTADAERSPSNAMTVRPAEFAVVAKALDKFKPGARKASGFSFLASACPTLCVGQALSV